MDRILFILCTIALGVFITTSLRFRSSGEPVYVWHEAEAADHVEPPVERVDGGPKVSGGKYVHIAEGKGGGALDGRGGHAMYRVSVPATGEYVLWARVRWNHGCSNSMYLAVDDATRSLLGEDGIYERWHWVRPGKSFSLAKGEHQFVFSNSEDGIGLDEFVLTNNPDYKPDGIRRTGGISRSAAGVPAGWSPTTRSRWSEQRAPGSALSEWVLQPSKLPLEEHILSADDMAATGFVLIAGFRVVQESTHRRSFRVLFDYRDRSNYRYVELADRRFTLGEKKDGREKMLVSGLDSRLLGDIDHHEIEVRRDSTGIEVLYDQARVLKAPQIGAVAGRVGLGSTYGGLYIASIQLAPIEPIYFASNFYVVDNQSTYVDDWLPQSGVWFRSYLREPATSYGVRSDVVALSTTGESYWRDYSFRAAVKSASHSGVGLCFYYRDKQNYHLLRMADAKSSKHYAGKIQLVGISNGREVVVAEEAVGIHPNQWYDLMVEVVDHRIRAHLDGVTVFEAIDSSGVQGGVGLYLDPSPGKIGSESKVRVLEGGYSAVFGMPILAEPGCDGIGLAFYYRNEVNYYLFRWNAAEHAAANALQLLRVVAGEEQVIAQRAFTAFAVGRMYNLGIELESGNIRAFVGSDEVLAVKDKPQRGRLGIYIGREPDDAYFDDVEVRSITFADFIGESRAVNPLPEEQQPRRYQFVKPQTVARDLAAWDVNSGFWDASFSHQAMVGQKEDEVDALVWHKRPVGGANIVIDAEVMIEAGSDPFFVICGNARDALAGYRFDWKHGADLEWITLSRNGHIVAEQGVKLSQTGTWITIRIEKTGARVALIAGATLIVDYQDREPLESSTIGIGIGGKAFKPTYFNSIVIR